MHKKFLLTLSYTKPLLFSVFVTAAPILLGVAEAMWKDNDEISNGKKVTQSSGIRNISKPSAKTDIMSVFYAPQTTLSWESQQVVDSWKKPGGRQSNFKKKETPEEYRARHARLEGTRTTTTISPRSYHDRSGYHQYKGTYNGSEHYETPADSPVGSFTPSGWDG